jgi:hypothetical protein
MATYGYGGVTDRAFVAYDRELDDGAWKGIAPKKAEEQASENAAALLNSPQLVIWKLRLRWGIAGVLTALGATALAELDGSWDSAQRRLFHRIAAGVDSEDRDVRAAADRLSAQILAGTGVAQTQYDFDAEVDFGLNQIALTQAGAPLAADAKALKLGDALADVAKTTEALAKGLGRGTGDKRRPPSRKLRSAIAECAASFNAVHEDLTWFVGRTPPGAERDMLTALLVPLEALLSRHASATPAASAPAEPTPPAPASPPKPIV